MPSFRLGIVGGRKTLLTFDAFEQIIDKVLNERGGVIPDTIVSGGATGIDAYAEMYAKKKGVPFLSCLPLKYTSKELLARNTLIVENSTFLIALPSEQSVGTWDTVRKATVKLGGDNVVVFRISDNACVVDGRDNDDDVLPKTELEKKSQPALSRKRQRFIQTTLDGDNVTSTLDVKIANKKQRSLTFQDEHEEPFDVDKHIFVFGSNAQGRHGKGAALFAFKHCGALYGKGAGFAGKSYAIPTKETPVKSLPLSSISVHVEAFVSFVKENPDKCFFLTRVGCGLAGFTDDQIAPLFADLATVSQVCAPVAWKIIWAQKEYGLSEMHSST